MRRFWVATCCALLVIGLWSGTAAAQSSGDNCPANVDIADFTDPVTGDIDFDAYTEALLCGAGLEDADAEDDGILSLARTGSNATDLALAGLALAAVGTAAVVGTRHRRSVESPV